jgi:hypothetical protein
MQERLTGAKSVTLHEFKNSSHLPNVEERETYNGKPLASPSDEHAPSDYGGIGLLGSWIDEQDL